MLFVPFISSNLIFIDFLKNQGSNYDLILDPYLFVAFTIISIVFLVRAVAIRKYGRKGVEQLRWARLAAWIGIICGYMLLIAHLLLR